MINRRRHSSTWVPSLLAALMLTGCGSEKSASQDEAATTYVYTCSDTRFTARFEPEAAVLTFPDRELRLPQVVSGSGARYSDGETTFWIKGESATLEIGGKLISDCHGEASKRPQ
ncbi:Membrane-bound lysozyme inhibitor of C-type lysozyme precursor [compost metagenome]